MNNELKVIIEEFNVDWRAIKNRARGTIGMNDSQKEPDENWIKKILIAEHSVLRHSLISIKIENISYCYAMHLVRHGVGTNFFVKSSREDRTEIKDRSERRQTDLIDMRIDMNIQSLINISRKRLCYQASPQTRKVWEAVVEEIAKYDKNIAWACCQEGIYKGGCSERFGNCNLCNNFLNTLTKEELIDIRKRYDAYNEFREGKVLKK